MAPHQSMMLAPGNTGLDTYNLNSDLGKRGFLAQISEDSTSSVSTAAYSLQEMSSPEFFTNKCLEIDAMASRVVEESKIKEAIQEAVLGSNFCVSVADPRAPGAPLIAVSEEFANMTGYHPAEFLGRNCRFLNDGCGNDLTQLRSACKTGAGCVTVLTNRCKSGELFLNLLDLSGLTVAENPATGEELWFLVGIHVDVTDMAGEGDGVRDEHVAEMHRVACCIRESLAGELSALAVSGAIHVNFAVPSDQSEDAWCLLPKPKWRCTEGWSPDGKRRTPGPVATRGEARPVQGKASEGCLAPNSRKALQSSHLTLPLVLLAGGCLLGSLCRQIVRCE